MDRKEFLATTFAAGLGLAFAPSLLSCISSQPLKNRSSL